MSRKVRIMLMISKHIGAVWSVFAEEVKDPMFLSADIKDTRMRILIWVFALRL